MEEVLLLADGRGIAVDVVVGDTVVEVMAPVGLGPTEVSPLSNQRKAAAMKPRLRPATAASVGRAQVG